MTYLGSGFDSETEHMTEFDGMNHIDPVTMNQYSNGLYDEKGLAGIAFNVKNEAIQRN